MSDDIINIHYMCNLVLHGTIEWISFALEVEIKIVKILRRRGQGGHFWHILTRPLNRSNFAREKAEDVVMVCCCRVRSVVLHGREIAVLVARQMESGRSEAKPGGRKVILCL